MRPLTLFIGSLLIMGAQAQSMLQHGAATAGAAMGAAAGKPTSDAITKIFSKTDASAEKAAKTPAKAPPKTTPKATQTAVVKATAKPGPPAPMDEMSKPSQHFNSQRAADVTHPPVLTIAPRAVVAPEPKEPSAAELANIKEGASESEMIAVLGQPGSRVSIPDDDGHLRETCQYWSKGQQIGTIRLDNGQVVAVQARN